MRLFILLLTFFSFSFSSNLLYTEQDNNRGVINYCIDDGFYYRGNYLYFYDLKTNNNRSINTKTLQKIIIIKGYEIDNSNNCFFDNSKYYGLSYEEFNFLWALYGIVISLLIGLSIVLAV